jgi:hypothetical protein
MLSPLDRKLALAPIDDEPLTPVKRLPSKPASLLSNRAVANRWERYSLTSA